MNVYAYISIQISGTVFSRHCYKLTNKDVVYFWEYVTDDESRSIELAYQINILIPKDRYNYYIRTPDIPFDDRDLEQPLLERGMW